MSLYSQYSQYSTQAAVTAAGVVTAAALYNLAGGALRQHFISKQTALNDLPKLGQPPNRKGKIRGTVLICGGSIAGLWAARICSDHFERVVIIEPDTWVCPEQNKVDASEYIAIETRDRDGLKTVVNKRTRVWQYHGPHGFQPLPVMAFRKLFPSFDEVARSMNILFRPHDLHSFTSGIPLSAPYHDYPVGKVPEFMIATRASLEMLLRKLLRESETCRNVHFVNGTVTGVVPSTTKPNHLEGVQVRLDGHKDAEFMPGDLVMDCTGPTQAFLKFLPRAGYGLGGPKPLADLRLHYEQRMKYTAAQFHITPEMEAKLRDMFPPIPNSTNPSDFKEGWENAAWLYAFHPLPELDNKMSFAKKLEGGNIVEVTVGGWGLDELPRTGAQVLEFVQSMITAPGYPLPPWIPELIKFLCDESAEEPVVAFYPTPSSSHVQYHLASNLPSNFIATGDAVMQLNPIFGQGCIKACMDAITLNAMLLDVRKDTLPGNFAKKFFNIQVDRTLNMWEKAKKQDYRFASTKPVAGEEKEQEKALLTQGGFINTYVLTLFKLSTTDKYVSSTMWHVFSMLAPATDLFAPRLIAKVAWARLSGNILEL